MIKPLSHIIPLFMCMLTVLFFTSCNPLSAKKITGNSYVISHNTNANALPFVAQVLWTSVDSHIPHRNKFIKILREQFRSFGISILMQKPSDKKDFSQNKMLFLNIQAKKYNNIANDPIHDTEHDNILIWTLESAKNKDVYEMFIPTTNQAWQNGHSQPIRLSVILGFKYFQKILNDRFDIADLDNSKISITLHVNANTSQENTTIFTQTLKNNLENSHMEILKNAPIMLAIDLERMKITNTADIFHSKSRLKISWNLVNTKNQHILYAFVQQNVIPDEYFTKNNWQNLVKTISKIGTKTMSPQIFSEDYNLKTHTPKRQKLIIPLFNKKKLQSSHE